MDIVSCPIAGEMLRWEEAHRVEGLKRSLGNKQLLHGTAREDRRQSIGFIRWL